MRKFWLCLVIFLALAGGAGWLFRGPLSVWWGRSMGGVELGLRQTLQPDPKTYETLKLELERWRVDLAKRHAAAKSEAERGIVEKDARLVLEQVLPQMMHCWLGTRWDFNGTAEKPGKGRIACGYFVATVLKDAGFRVDRYQLAQQPSERILRTFLPKEACDLTIGEAYATFSTGVEKSEAGIYLVGLDTHVGFLVVRPDHFQMVHSSGSRPWCVVEEDKQDAHVLQKSNWRMIGNLTSDPQVLKRWIKAGRTTVKKD
jgi:hypothetical protein